MAAWQPQDICFCMSEQQTQSCAATDTTNKVIDGNQHFYWSNLRNARKHNLTSSWQNCTRKIITHRQELLTKYDVNATVVYWFPRRCRQNIEQYDSYSRQTTYLKQVFTYVYELARLYYDWSVCSSVWYAEHCQKISPLATIRLWQTFWGLQSSKIGYASH